MFRRSNFFWLAAGLGLAAATFRLTAEPARRPLPGPGSVQDKSFYVLTLLEQRAAAQVAADPVLQELAAAKRRGLETAAQCASDLECYLGPLRFSDEEIARAAGALRQLCAQHREIQELVSGPLRDSGLYVRSHAMSDAELLAEAWRQSARGINRAIDVYGGGRAPRYPAIDSISYDITKPGYGRILQLTAATLLDDAASLPLFFHPSLRFALLVMDHNRRDEAARHEPLHLGENRSAAERLRARRDWDRYPYSAIVVPGAGNDRPNWPLSAVGKLRVQLAVKRYREGKAPVILVSGGYVHPMQTPYAEAVEMKKALMRDFGVPEEAILIDPHARHTTTNLRNAARLLYRYGTPWDKPALITTDPGQSAYIEAPAFGKRCGEELGYLPYRALKRISPFDLEFLPALDSLQSDPNDPLDP